eukprot:692900-Hanusia_phi.AAC.1
MGRGWAQAHDTHGLYLPSEYHCVGDVSEMTCGAKLKLGGTSNETQSMDPSSAIPARTPVQHGCNR